MIQALTRDIFRPQSSWEVAIKRLLRQHHAVDGIGFAGLSLVGSQHLLPSILPLFEALFDLGLAPSRTFLVAKQYSTREAVYRALEQRGVRIAIAQNISPGRFEEELLTASRNLWQLAQSDLVQGGCILLDHGGFLRATAPLKIGIPLVAIEHTTKGTFVAPSRYFPCIDMARSTLKSSLEPRIIAHGVLRGLRREFARLAPKKIGVIGVGSIGSAVAELLVEERYPVIAYDTNPSRLQTLGYDVSESAKKVFESADVVIGCTGADISNALLEAQIQGECRLVSVSSGDCEFAHLLRENAHNLLPDGTDFLLSWKNGAVLRIIQQGFPINLAMEEAELSLEEIWLTRSLTFGCLLQASRLLQHHLYLPVDTNTQLAIRETSEVLAATRY